MISLNSARDISIMTYQKATHVFSIQTKPEHTKFSTLQENTAHIDEITPSQLALISTQAHSWITIISDKPLRKHALLNIGVDIDKIINITHEQISASRINCISKHNQSYVVMLQKNQSRQLAHPFYSQLIQQCEEQNLRLLSLTQQHTNNNAEPVQLTLLNFDMQTA